MALMNFLDMTPPNQQPMTQTERGSTEEEESTEDIAQHQDFSPHFFEYEDDESSFTGTSGSDTDEDTLQPTPTHQKGNALQMKSPLTLLANLTVTTLAKIQVETNQTSQQSSILSCSKWPIQSKI